LVRAREDARLDRMRARRRLSKFLLRRERSMPTKCWGVTGRGWLAEQTFPFEAQQHAFDDTSRRSTWSTGASRRSSARCARPPSGGPGRNSSRMCAACAVSTPDRAGVVCEVGDFAGSATAEEFMSFTGLVRSERSCGERRKQGSITKADNAHLRRLLVEAAWNARRPRSVTNSPAANATRIPPPSSVPGAANSACQALAADGRPRQAPPEDRRRLRPRARRVRLGDRHQPAAQKGG
jgi:transposase